MIVNAELYVKDLPGQLVGSLEPISVVDGNILGVVHNRERIVNHRICINITFEAEDDQLERLKAIWKSKDIIISKIGTAYETFTMDYMLIGDIDARYIERLIILVQDRGLLQAHRHALREDQEPGGPGQAGRLPRRRVPPQRNHIREGCMR